MKYKGIYWSLFAPMIKKSIANRFDRELAQVSIKQGKKEYRRLLRLADDPGPGNPMAMNACFAYVFAAAWLGSGKKITPDEMAEVMTDVLTSPLMRIIFGMTDLNKKPKKWYKDMKKYEAWYEKHSRDYPVNWIVNFDESMHSEGSYYYFTRCPMPIRVIIHMDIGCIVYTVVAYAVGWIGGSASTGQGIIIAAIQRAVAFIIWFLFMRYYRAEAKKMNDKIQAMK